MELVAAVGDCECIDRQNDWQMSAMNIWEGRAVLHLMVTPDGYTLWSHFIATATAALGQ